MLPRVLGAINDQVRRRAVEVVDAALRRGEVDGVDLATALPMAVIPELVGWPADQREHLIEWAGATFDILGPGNRRMVAGIPARYRCSALPAGWFGSAALSPAAWPMTC